MWRFYHDPAWKWWYILHMSSHDRYTQSSVCVCVQTSTTTSLNETLYPNLGMMCPKKSLEVLVLDAFGTTQ